MADSKRDILIVGLRNASDRLTNYPQLKAAVDQHIKETERQQQMVEEALGRFGETPSTLKEAAMKLAGNLQAITGATHELSGISVQGAVSEEAVQERPELVHLGLAISLLSHPPR